MKPDYSKWHYAQHSAMNLGSGAMVLFSRHMSASRLAMWASQSSQALTLENSTVRRTLTSVEREYGKYTHAIKFPCHARVIRVLDRYPKSMGYDDVKENPERTVIYQDMDQPNAPLRMLKIPRYHCNHQYFGFRYVYTEAFYRLGPEQEFEAGTVLAQTPSLDEQGNYKYGIGANLALLSVEGTIEDGGVASDEWLGKLSVRSYGSRTMSFGGTKIPLNLNGDDTSYKVVPDIGDFIKPDGLLMATREIDLTLAASQCSKAALRRLDPYDVPEYGVANARVVDIIVHRGKNHSTLPKEMTAQFDKYYNKSLAYYQKIYETYQTLLSAHKRNGGNEHTLRVSPEFQQEYVYARGVIECSKPNSRIQPMMQVSKIDECMITVVFEYVTLANIGNKTAGNYGDKNIVCAVWPKSRMPRDAEGNVADLIVSPHSRIARNIPGATYEPLINNCFNRLVNQMRADIDFTNPSSIRLWWDRFLTAYRIVSPPMYIKLTSGVSSPEKHLRSVCQHGHYLLIAPDNPVETLPMLKELVEKFPPVYGPVKYVTSDGVEVTTKDKVLIGEAYFIMLEKVGNTWTAVASPKYQHYGVPAKITNADKYHQPGRNQPVRFLGESEVRLLVAVCGGHVVAELMDQTNNFESHISIINTILRSPMPTAIANVIDRRLIPRGNGRILRLVKHMLFCAGVRFVYHGDMYATIERTGTIIYPTREDVFHS